MYGQNADLVDQHWYAVGEIMPSCHTDLDSHTSKRSACHLMNDIIHTSNFIDRRSKPNSAPPSELLLDNHPSRTNDENRVPSQNSFPKSLSKRITKSNLIDRIALPSRDFNLAFTYDSTTLTKKRFYIVAQKFTPNIPSQSHYQR
ncbi:hypothetical protein Pst134EA_021437 [Puccinia striiformis f. sp. tritici]|uniref:hypothetical protein n=1 Tax=Puccinia striiformis f. sp. tritici TaxID=168172 RepID=UPI0020072F72|nr:hypothetical protein Pst134EA_021437 [Puccinia striiformis f. sp. tritici]KAH9457564.1 hypothetical protein Pst134EA_021437 [Puccinia striiformis f. sp. tritici]